MKKPRKVVLAISIAILSVAGIGSSVATPTHRTGLVEAVQMDNHSVTGREDIVWIKLTGAWSGTACPADWGYFNAKENPQLVATALVARSTQAPLDIYVDDSYAKVSGFCLITNLVL
jgi:hypothetical protein